MIWFKWLCFKWNTEKNWHTKHKKWKFFSQFQWKMMKYTTTNTTKVVTMCCRMIFGQNLFFPSPCQLSRIHPYTRTRTMCHNCSWEFGINLKLVWHFYWQPENSRNLNFKFVFLTRIQRGIFGDGDNLLLNALETSLNEWRTICHHIFRVQLVWLVIDNSSKFLIRKRNCKCQ